MSTYTFTLHVDWWAILKYVGCFVGGVLTVIALLAYGMRSFRPFNW